MTTLRDGLDLASELDANQRHLAELDKEQQEAIIAYRDAKHQLLIAEARRDSVRGAIDILKARGMHLMSLARLLPK